MKTRANAVGMELDLVNYGIASRIGKTIIMNKDLLKYKSFCLGVFKHELRHGTKLSKNDILMDSVEGSVLTNLAFCFMHPKGFTQFIPFGVYKKKFLIDVNLIVVYLIGFLFIKGFFWLF